MSHNKNIKTTGSSIETRILSVRTYRIDLQEYLASFKRTLCQCCYWSVQTCIYTYSTVVWYWQLLQATVVNTWSHGLYGMYCWGAPKQYIPYNPNDHVLDWYLSHESSIHGRGFGWPQGVRYGPQHLPTWLLVGPHRTWPIIRVTRVSAIS